MNDSGTHVRSVVAMDFLHEVEAHGLQDWVQLVNRGVLLQVGLEDIHGPLWDGVMNARAVRVPLEEAAGWCGLPGTASICRLNCRLALDSPSPTT